MGAREGQGVFPAWPPRTAGAAPALFRSGPLRLSLGQGLAPWCGVCPPRALLAPTALWGPGLDRLLAALPGGRGHARASCSSPDGAQLPEWLAPQG